MTTTDRRFCLLVLAWAFFVTGMKEVASVVRTCDKVLGAVAQPPAGEQP